jgi:hypothetical protein
MKRLLIIIILTVLLTPVVKAQTDTVQWGYGGYHYSLWYDTLPEFYTYYLNESRPALKLWEWYYDFPNEMFAMPQHVDGPTPLYGVAVTEPIEYSRSVRSIIRNDWYLPEYVYLFQKVGDTLVLLDSARWDTVPPKVMKLAMNADTDRYGFELVKVYEAMFKGPVTVDSVFYTVSSNNGKDAPCGGVYEWAYRPVWPMMVSNWGPVSGPQWCAKPSWWELKAWNMQTRQWSTSYSHINSPFFCMYFPIVDYVELMVESADTTMGTAGPVAHVARNTTQSIWARPKQGYKFSHWREDGGIHATRSVYIVWDTTRYTAVFEPAARCRVEGRSNDEAMGYVTVGDSVYYEGDTAVLEAYAAEGYVFDHWSTGDTANPLRIVVAGNMVVTAYFESRGVGILSADGEGGAFVLSPNPARGQATVTLTEGFEGGTLTVRDAAGREVLRKELARGTRECVLDVSVLPSGTYFVTLTTAKGTGTQKLVIN